MELSPAEVLALQHLARGPVGGDSAMLELAAVQLSALIPAASLFRSRLRSGIPLRSVRLAEPLAAAQLETVSEGALYLATEPNAERTVLVLRLPQGEVFQPRQQKLLRLASAWLEAWFPRTDEEEDAQLALVGSAVRVDRQGAVVQADDVARELLARAGGLKAHLLSLFQDYVTKQNRHAERVVEVPGLGVMRLRAEFYREASDTCFMSLEVLSPGSNAMFLAQTNGLSAREIQVARLVRDGWGNKGIGDKLGLAPATVNMYLGRIYGKLELKNRTELTRYLSGMPNAG